MVTEKMPKMRCDLCDFGCSKLSNWNAHLLTSKHQFVTNCDKTVTQNNSSTYMCSNCNKVYNSRNGLWSHSKKCKQSKNDDTDIVEQLLKQNNEFKTIILEQNKMFVGQSIELQKQTSEIQKQNQDMHKQILEVCKNGIIANNTVNSHNKTFNLQVFLNEDCKDAMNVSDFMNSLNLQVSDLECVGQLGFVEGISNIIIKRLNAMDITKRPVHCTDSKRETIYIKEDGVWTKDDDDNMKIRKLVRGVSSRNCKNAGAYKAMYPEWKDPESKHSYIYDKIVLEAFGGTNNGKDEENENKIIRKILKHLTIDKSAFIQ
jgi:hypothetical protein